jgi:hypothetical protein
MCPITRNHIALRTLSESAELTLGQCPEHNDALGHARRNGGRRIGNGSRASSATTTPLHIGKS